MFTLSALGLPRWGPVRATAVEARADVAVLTRAAQDGRLEDCLLQLHAGTSTEFAATAGPANSSANGAAAGLDSGGDFFD